MEITR
jgi:hypothetical protein